MKNLTAAQIKEIAKGLKVKNWWLKKKDELIQDIIIAKGWDKHTPEIQGFLLNGGEIKELPPAGDPSLRVSHQESASMKRRKPTKSKKAKTEKKAKAPKVTGDMITLSMLCDELGIEPRVARRRLRNSEIQKPEAGWNWNPGDELLSQVKGVLK